jgi:hypothetical protein
MKSKLVQLQAAVAGTGSRNAATSRLDQKKAAISGHAVVGLIFSVGGVKSERIHGQYFSGFHQAAVSGSQVVVAAQVQQSMNDVQCQLGICRPVP